MTKGPPTVTTLGASVERNAVALESFHAPDDGPAVKCPACGHQFDPSGAYRAIPLFNRTGLT